MKVYYKIYSPYLLYLCLSGKNHCKVKLMFSTAIRSHCVCLQGRVRWLLERSRGGEERKEEEERRREERSRRRGEEKENKR